MDKPKSKWNKRKRLQKSSLCKSGKGILVVWLSARQTLPSFLLFRAINKKQQIGDIWNRCIVQCSSSCQIQGFFSNCTRISSERCHLLFNLIKNDSNKEGINKKYIKLVSWESQKLWYTLTYTAVIKKLLKNTSRKIGKMLIPNLKRVGTLSQGIGVPDGSDVL